MQHVATPPRTRPWGREKAIVDRLSRSLAVVLHEERGDVAGGLREAHHSPHRRVERHLANVDVGMLARDLAKARQHVARSGLRKRERLERETESDRIARRAEQLRQGLRVCLARPPVSILAIEVERLSHILDFAGLAEGLEPGGNRRILSLRKRPEMPKDAFDRLRIATAPEGIW